MAFKFEDIGDLSYIKRITLDTSGGNSLRIVEAKQGDIKSRYLEITVTQNDTPLNIADGVTPRIRGTKPDGKSFLVDGDVNSGLVYIEFTEQMLAAVGRVRCDVGLYSGESLLSTVTFYVDVAAKPYDENKVESSDEFSALNDALLRIENADDIAGTALANSEQALENLTVLDEAEAARVAAEIARASAEQGRSSAESARVTAEQTRTKNETDRVNAEKARVTAESGRVQAEKDRVSAEASRATAEETRSGNEENRVTSEEDRAAAELIRGENEAARVSAENTRKTNEENRVSAEAKRQAAYANFQNDIDDNEIAAGLILNHSRQVQWKVDDFLKTDIGTVTLTNTLDFPFNDSIQSVALSDERLNTDYIVITELVSADGVAGEIEVSDKLVNGFKIAYTGSASSVTIKYVVMGGYSV